MSGGCPFFSKNKIVGRVLAAEKDHLVLVVTLLAVSLVLDVSLAVIGASPCEATSSSGHYPEGSEVEVRMRCRCCW